MGWIELCLNLKIIIYLIKYSNLRNSKLKKVYCFCCSNFKKKSSINQKKYLTKRFLPVWEGNQQFMEKCQNERYKTLEKCQNLSSKVLEKCQSKVIKALQKCRKRGIMTMENAQNRSGGLNHAEKKN